jgi:hypothetical protein
MMLFPIAVGRWPQVAALAGGAAPTAPAQFGGGDWSVADDATGGAVTITIASLPSDGGSAILDLEYQIDGGSWVSLSDTTTGDYPVSGLTDDVEVDIAIRAVNAIGNGTASATKAVTPTQGALFATIFQTSNDTTIVVPVPAGAEDGDVLVMYVSGMVQTASVPAGWTLLQHITTGPAGNFGSVCCWRVASSEPADYTVTKGASNRGAAVMVAIPGLDTSVPFSAYSSEQIDDNGTAAGGMILKPVISNGLLYIFGTTNFDTVADNESWTIDGAMSSIASGNTSGGDGAGRHIVIANETLGSSADIDRNWTFSHSYELARIGLVARPSGAAVPPIRVASYTRVIDTAASGSLAVPYPSGIANGDLLLLCVAKGIGASSAPSGGWSLVNRTTTEASAVGVWSLVADGTEAGTVSITKSNSSGRSVGMMLRVVGGDTIAASTNSATLSNGTTLTIPSVTAAANDDLFIAFGGSNWGDATSDGYTNFGGMNVIIGTSNTGDGTNGIIAAAAWEAVASGATGTRSWPMWRSLHRTAVSLVVTT